jgi:hypothetical protein
MNFAAIKKDFQQLCFLLCTGDENKITITLWQDLPCIYGNIATSEHQPLHRRFYDQR